MLLDKGVFSLLDCHDFCVRIKKQQPVSEERFWRIRCELGQDYISSFHLLLEKLSAAEYLGYIAEGCSESYVVDFLSSLVVPTNLSAPLKAESALFLSPRIVDFCAFNGAGNGCRITFGKAEKWCAGPYIRKEYIRRWIGRLASS
ncbi:16K protein [Blueberry green mosaic associated virus]|uniref:16K protein n=1 Tax=Blueberry green mosaic associated virus TaxID=2605718 RepID=A0AAF1DAW4_9VIRU|nr:16K protein [Blueberry green mosaic associated virus]QEH60474.1 16K protein [Blueberry green mosaic associated virus]